MAVNTHGVKIHAVNTSILITPRIEYNQAYNNANPAVRYATGTAIFFLPATSTLSITGNNTKDASSSTRSHGS
ncbi:MAG TPA: hypothetical protein DEU93_00330 [Chitinophagaceae bacterium]|nr:hypothetical protein [Chitinophagaceae bacterium]